MLPWRFLFNSRINLSCRTKRISLRDFRRYEHYLLSILSTISSSLTRFRLNVKVDQEKDGEESSEKNGKVGTELNLKGKGLGGKGLYDGVHGEGGGGDGRDGDCGNGSFLHVEAGFGDALGN